MSHGPPYRVRGNALPDREPGRGVITDSGTVVEETCVLGVPSLQMRKSTERPQVYDVGSSVKFDPAEAENYPAESIYQQAGDTAWPQVATHARRRAIVGANCRRSPSAPGWQGLRASQAGALSRARRAVLSRGTGCSALSPQAHADGSVQGPAAGRRARRRPELCVRHRAVRIDCSGRAARRDGSQRRCAVRGRSQLGVSLILVSSLTRTRSPSHLCLRLRSGGFEEHPARPNGRRCRPSPDFRARGGRSGQTVARFEPADLRTWNKSGVQPLDDSASFAFESITADPIVHASTSVQMTDVPWWRERLDPRAALYVLQDWLFDRPLSVAVLLLPASSRSPAGERSCRRS